MAKNSNKINDNDDKNEIPSGEDQYLLGWNDAERLENLKPGMAKAFIKLSSIIPSFHPEYVKGYEGFVQKHISEQEISDLNLADKEFCEKFAKTLQELMKK